MESRSLNFTDIKVISQDFLDFYMETTIKLKKMAVQSNISQPLKTRPLSFDNLKSAAASESSIQWSAAVPGSDHR